MTNEIEKIIFDYITPEIQQIFYSAISSAVIEGLKLKSQKPYLKKRSVSNINNDEICNNVSEMLKSKGYKDGDVFPYDDNTSLRISMGNGAVIVRFKKMTSTGATSNIVTQEVLNFEEQQPKLYNIRPTVNINAGYFLLRDGMDFKVLLSHPNGLGKIDWTYEIPSSINTEVIPTPQPTKKSSTGGIMPREAKPKEGMKKDEYNNS
ncbi:hypothetical protein [Pectinatus frisingensis]|uniref:hypothetical protein n=1 Tax=Pectinatus frisingensis TaxID=865 RepID=UPI0018C4A2FF|nr:hypothetical protein [Pectinatus frisingensis]